MRVYRKKYGLKIASKEKVEKTIRKAYVKVELNAATAWELDFKGIDDE